MRGYNLYFQTCTHTPHRSNSQDTSSPLMSKVREENQCLRYQLHIAESQFSSKMSKMRGLLQECCRKEWTHLDSNRRTAEEQMSRAQKVVGLAQEMPV